MRDNYPYFHPLYAGQMLKPPHPVARLAYALAMWINPNNHALDGGRASSAMEKEAVAGIARMFGWDDAPRPPARRRHDGEPRGAVGRARAAPGQADRSRRRRRTTRTRGSVGVLGAAVRGDRRRRARPHGRRRARARAGRAATSAPSSRRWARRRLGAVDPLPEILDAARARTASASTSTPPTAATSRWPTTSRRDARAHSTGIGEADSIVDRSAQARPAALRLRLRAVPRSRRRPLLPARLALHLLQLDRAAPRRDQPRVLAARARPRSRCGRRSSCCRSCAAASSRGARSDAGAAALALHAALARGRALRRRASRPSSTSSSGPCARRRAAESSAARARDLREGRERGLHLALAELPAAFFGDRWGAAATVTACARS